MELFQYPIPENNLSCLFDPTMYNTAMCPLLLTASVKINK